MTDPEMNARHGKIVIGLIAVGLVACLGGCGTALGARIDAESSAAPRVQALIEANRKYPRWADFPAAPVDLPEPVAIAQRVNTLRVTSGALAGEVSRIAWTLDDAVAFAQGVNARVAATPIAPATVRTQAEIDAYAEALRRRGTAPPPVDRR